MSLTDSPLTAYREASKAQRPTGQGFAWVSKAGQAPGLSCFILLMFSNFCIDTTFSFTADN